MATNSAHRLTVPFIAALPWVMLLVATPAIIVCALGVAAAWQRHPAWGLTALSGVGISLWFAAHLLQAAPALATQHRALRSQRFQSVLLALTQFDDTNWSELIRQAVETVAASLEVQRVGVWLFTPDGKGILCADVYHRRDGHHEDGMSICATDCPAYLAALRENRTLAVADAQVDPRTCELNDTYLRALGIHGMLDVPIRRHNQLIGVLCHEDTRIRDWMPEEQEFVASVSDRIALALEGARRREAEAALRRVNETLEHKVAQRTAELQSAHDQLTVELEQRRKAQNEIHRLSDDLKIRANELEIANADLKSFTYSVSHDLRAPLRAINGFAQILTRRHRDSLNDEGRHYLDNVLEAGDSMGRLIDSLLAYSRLGRQSIDIRPIELAEVFDSVFRDHQVKIQETRATLTLPERPPRVLGDLTLLGQVFANLLENALKYKRIDVSPVIAITVQPREDRVIVTVADNGIGIAPEYHAKIFHVFQRLHSDADVPGSGIGLASVKKAVERLGGKVWVESPGESGSRFHVELLAAPSTSPATITSTSVE